MGSAMGIHLWLEIGELASSYLVFDMETKQSSALVGDYK